MLTNKLIKIYLTAKILITYIIQPISSQIKKILSTNQTISYVLAEKSPITKLSLFLFLACNLTFQAACP